MATATAASLKSAAVSQRIPALDGWRGIAILLVLADHTQAAFLGRYARPWTQTGQHGVTLFFVLSGFLITGKLLEGQSLRTFYIRRFFRLMPAAWSYLAFLGMVELLLHLRVVSLSGVVSCIFFFRNYSSSHLLATGHFWSLSMEEQFYLVWPCLLLLAGFKKARWVAVVGAIACAVYRFLFWSHYSHQWLSFRTEVRCDALLVGCLLALLFHDAKLRAVITRASKYLALPALAVFAFCITQFPWLPPLYEDVAIAILLAASVAYPHGVLARLMSLPPLAWLGLVSYSIYVWQQFFFKYRGADVTATMIAIMPIFALGSYHLIEKPCIRFGHRLTHGQYSRPAETTQFPAS